MDVHEYREDPRFRSFHVNLNKIPDTGGELQLRLAAASGTPWVTYSGVGIDAAPSGNDAAPWTAAMDLDLPNDIDFFFPYTTTLLEIRINREPTNDLVKQRLHLMHFIDS